MKELVIISGKGGTGKTSIVAALATLAPNKILVDCDVDASDLHLILKPEIVKTIDFYAGKKPAINQTLCTKCGVCQKVCRFDAVLLQDTNFVIDEIKCEGCGACYFECPANAITFDEVKSGQWFESSTRLGPLIHARLGIAEENSGKLVAEVKNAARVLAKKNALDLIMIDGSPGIGCPVIASISGADLVMIVTEPTISGLHDAERVLELTKHFKIPACMCINKFDINLDMAEKIEEFCYYEDIDLVGKIAYSDTFSQAMIAEKSVVEFLPKSGISKELRQIWQKLEYKLKIN